MYDGLRTCSWFSEYLSPKSGVPRAGGIERIAVRVGLGCIAQADIRVIVDCIPKFRALLERDPKGNEVITTRLFQVLSRLLRELRGWLCTEDARRRESGKAIVPLIKDLLRYCLPAISRSTAEKLRLKELAELSQRATIRMFMESITAGGAALWQPFIDYIDAVSAQVEAEERAAAIQILKTRRKTFLSTCQVLEKEEMSDAATERRLQGEVNELAQRFIALDQQRRAEARKCRSQREQRAARQWRHIWRSLTSERAAWGHKETQGTSSPPPPAARTSSSRLAVASFAHRMRAVYWKLDKTENFSRMRLKLRRNYNFNDHKDASYRSGEGPRVVSGHGNKAPPLSGPSSHDLYPSIV